MDHYMIRQELNPEGSDATEPIVNDQIATTVQQIV
jgi:hypothetical protein